MKKTTFIITVLVLFLSACNSQATPVATVTSVVYQPTEYSVQPTSTPTIQVDPRIACDFKSGLCNDIVQTSAKDMTNINMHAGETITVTLLDRTQQFANEEDLQYSNAGQIIIKIKFDNDSEKVLSVGKFEIVEQGFGNGTSSVRFGAKLSSVDTTDIRYDGAYKVAIKDLIGKSWTGTLREASYYQATGFTDLVVEFPSIPTEADLALDKIGITPDSFSEMTSLGKAEQLTLYWAKYATKQDWQQFRSAVGLPKTAGEYYGAQSWATYLEKDLLESKVSLEVSVFPITDLYYYEESWTLLVYDQANIPSDFMSDPQKLDSTLFVDGSKFTAERFDGEYTIDAVVYTSGTIVHLTLPSGQENSIIVPEHGIFVILQGVQRDDCECFSPIASWVSFQIYE
jgi:hypothetical protein